MIQNLSSVEPIPGFVRTLRPVPRCSDCRRPVAYSEKDDPEPLCLRCRGLERDEAREILTESQKQPQRPELARNGSNVSGGRPWEIPSSAIVQTLNAPPIPRPPVLGAVVVASLVVGIGSLIGAATGYLGG